MLTRRLLSTLQNTISIAKNMANYYIGSSFRLRIMSILIYQLLSTSFTWRASQFFISSTKGLLTRLVDSYKILAQNTLKIPYVYARSILIWAFPIKLLQMQVRTLLAKNFIKMRMQWVLGSKLYQLRLTILLAKSNATMQLSAELTLLLMPKFKGLLRKQPYK